MTNYFVRKNGSDAAAGTSAGAAWLTLGKALGAAGIASGDTVYIGAGVYREAVTAALGYRGYLFDLDGTIYLGEALLPGAKAVVAGLRDAGRRVAFLSN